MHLYNSFYLTFKELSINIYTSLNKSHYNDLYWVLECYTKNNKEAPYLITVKEKGEKKYETNENQSSISSYRTFKKFC